MEKRININRRNYLVPIMGAGKIVLLQNKEGKFLIPAFTDETQAEKMKAEDIRLEPLSYERLKGIVIDAPHKLDGIVIDPFGDNLVLNHSAIENIDRLSQGMAVRRTDHTGKLKLWQPAQQPDGLAEALAAHLNKQECVREAWIFMLQDESEAAPHWAFVLDFEGDRKVIFPPVAKVIQPFMKPGENFELMKAEGDLGVHAKTKGVPFYRREGSERVVLN